MKVSFDIGGVLSKHPHLFRQLITALRAGGVEVFILTDMHDHDQSVRFMRENRFDVPDDHIVNSDYALDGERCKQVQIERLGIDLHVDDFPGYCAAGGCVQLFVWPDPNLPYYHDDFVTDGSEGDFGRRRPQPRTSKN